MERQRVVVTGLGTVNPLANSVTDTWEALKAGRSGIGPITRFDPSEHVTKIAGEVKGFNPTDFMDRREARKMDRFSQYATASAIEAMADAGLEQGSFDPARAGTIMGVGIGGFETLEASYRVLFDKGPSRVPPMTIPKLISNIGPGNVAIHFGLHGPAYSVATACASGTDAIGNAFHWVRAGHGDFVIAGGVEACITEMGLAGFNVIHALAGNYNDRPEEASRPFDKDRDGFVLAEGAGIVVVESLEHARKRGASIYAEVIGSGISCDANHLTQPHPEGRGAREAMEGAIADAGIAPEEIDYVNAHGTSTAINDPTETKAIKEVLGEHAYRVKVSSSKSMSGHLIGAAGGFEALVCALAIRNGYIPPTINLHEPGEGCDLDYVPNVGVEAPVRVAMSNSLGFGGHNGVLLLKRYEE